MDDEIPADIQAELEGMSVNFDIDEHLRNLFKKSKKQKRQHLDCLFVLAQKHIFIVRVHIFLLFEINEVIHERQ